MLHLVRDTLHPNSSPKRSLGEWIRAAWVGGWSNRSQQPISTLGRKISWRSFGPHHPVSGHSQAQWNAYNCIRLMRQKQLFNVLRFPDSWVVVNESANFCFKWNRRQRRANLSIAWIWQPFVFLDTHSSFVTNAPNQSLFHHLRGTQNTLPCIGTTLRFLGFEDREIRKKSSFEHPIIGRILVVQHAPYLLG